MGGPVKETIRLLRDKPGEWVVDKYHAIHTPTRLSLWIANGWPSVRCDSNRVYFYIGPVSRWRVWRAVRFMVAHNAAEKLRRVDNGQD